MTQLPTISDKESLRQILDLPGRNDLKDLLTSDASKQLAVAQNHGSQFRLHLTEIKPNGQNEVYRINDYSEHDLARAAGQPSFRFRWKCGGLAKHAHAVALLEERTLEFEQSATLLWAEVKALGQYLGTAPEIDEIITGLHIAVAQFVTKLTSQSVVVALAKVFDLVSKHSVLSTKIVDQALDELNAVGVDLNFPMSFAKDDG